MFSIRILVALNGLVGLLVAVPSTASVGNCSNADAPNGYNNQTCHSVCTESGSELLCETDTLCSGLDGVTATAVTGFGSSTHDVSIWGECLGQNSKFCCVFDETSTTDTVTLDGTDEVDEVLSFTWHMGEVDEENLKPWDTDHLDGYIRGNEAGDLILGSNYAATDYDDHLYGQNGNDTMHGNAGGDFLSGGNHDDTMTGAGGNDTMWGGDGDDAMAGGADNDKLCDASGYGTCATNEGNFMDGGAGDDKLWYNESENPNVPCPDIVLDQTSTAGSGTDQCGDENDYVQGDLPGECDTYLTIEPTLCEGAY